MTDDTLAQLHDKVTRGEQLTPEQRSQLAAWYAHHDEEESDQLSVVAVPDDLAGLRRQLNEAMSELSASSQRVRELASDNDSLRCQIQDLQRELTRRTPTHSG